MVLIALYEGGLREHSPGKRWPELDSYVTGSL